MAPEHAPNSPDQDPMQSTFSSGVEAPVPPKKSKRGLIAGITVVAAGIAAAVGSMLPSQTHSAEKPQTDDSSLTTRVPETTIPTPETTVPKVEVFDGNEIKVGDELECAVPIILVGPEAKRYSSTHADEARISSKTTEISTALTDTNKEWIAYYRLNNGQQEWEYVKADDPAVQIRTGANDAREPLGVLDTKSCTVVSIEDGNINVDGLDYGETDYPMPVGAVVAES